MNKKKILGVSLFLVLIAVLATVFLVFSGKDEKKEKETTNQSTENVGSQETEALKEVVIEVVNSKGESKKYELNTDAEYLRGAMEEAEGLEFSGAESEYGMMVDTVNGEKADYSTDGAYWSFYVNGEYCMSGIDTQPVNDGDEFQIKYEK